MQSATYYALLCFFYIIYTQIFIIVKYKQITRKYFIPLVIFAFPPLIGGILQIAFSVSFVPFGMTISMLVIFLNIQNDQLYTDHLTGLSNRRHLDRYLEERTRKGSKGKLLAGIMMDMDFFKHINDTWGHSAGDQALEYTGEILKMSFRKNDLICRYGGDEFLVILEIEKESDIMATISRLEMNAQRFIEQNPTPYKINFSIGYDIYDFGQGTEVQQFLKHIDKLMYENKRYKQVLY